MFHKKLYISFTHPLESVKRFTHLSVGIHVVVRLRRIDLGQQESCLRSAVLRVNVAWHGETCLQYFLGIIDGRLQQLLKVLILWHVLVLEGTPLGNSLAMIDEYLEKCVHQQYAIRLYRGSV